MATAGDTWERVRARARDALEAADRRAPTPVTAIVRRFADRQILLQASSLAFYGLISALPLLVIAFAVVGGFTGEGTLDRFAAQVSESGPGGTGRVIEQLISSAETLSWVMLVVTIWPATAYGGGLRRALAYGSSSEPKLPGLRGRLIGLGFVLVLPVLTLAGIPLTFVLTRFVGDGAVGQVVGGLLAFVIASLFGTGVAHVLYQTFPPTDIDARDSLTVAAVAAATIAAFSLAFVVYLNVGNTEERFGGGTMGLVVMFGVWIFVANILLLAGYHAVLEVDEEAS